MRRVVQRHLRGDNLPPPLMPTWPVLWWLALDRMGAPGWVVGAAVAVSTMAYLLGLRRLLAGVSVDVVGNQWTPRWSDRDPVPPGRTARPPSRPAVRTEEPELQAADSRW
jgi:hypothetical protein